MEPLFVVPVLVCGSLPDGRRDNFDRAMAYNKPLGLRSWKDQKTATIRPFSTVGFADRTPQLCDAKSWPWNVAMAEGGFKRRDPAITEVAGWCFPFNGHLEIASDGDSAELHAQVADEQHECDAHGPPLGALIVDVNSGDCEIGARLVGSSAELAANHHALEGPRRVPERAGDAIVLGDHVEVLRQGTFGDEARPLLYANPMPRAIEVRSQQAWIRTSCASRVPREVLEFVSRTSAALVRLKSRRLAGRLIQKLRSRLTGIIQVRNESGAPA